ncbi:disintegrin and metalloproteinase domain-containing protein 10-like isoform X2 [Ornithodoros turicata]|uniref:disintegrin and metalloproteinase domain-containing protein 10-like isoform X2 n=1 Tax=Ornithodoros turicata TaxID=34597 RepID=UPI0031389D44
MPAFKNGSFLDIMKRVVHTLLVAMLLPEGFRSEDHPSITFIRYYEALSYDTIPVEQNHRRNKRSANSHDSRLHLAFEAYNRHFHLSLQRDRSSFSPDFVMETSSEGRVQTSLDHIYSGYLMGDTQSRVSGYILDGLFFGRITTATGEYYVERASRYLENDSGFHSIIYSAKDVTYPGVGCGLHGITKEWMEDIQRRYRHSRSKRRRPKRWSKEYTDTSGEPRFFNYDTHMWKPSASNITRRGNRRQETEVVKRVCNMEITIDHSLYEYLLLDMGDDFKTREAISGLVSTHVATASEIFRSTDFYGITDISFDAQRVIIKDHHSCEGEAARTSRFCSDNLDASHLLHELSRINHDSFCLSYIWTYRDFSRGTLGLAYVAELDESSGGICERFQTGVASGVSVEYRGKLSLNTGVISFLNQNSRIPEHVSQMTFTHELGHSFGASHDKAECAPGGAIGNYIMYASATLGDKPNNRKFSPCSIQSISRVLHPLFTGDSARPNCLQEPRGPFCGNNIRDPGEECDCGYEEKDCKDNCCYPREHREVSRKGCTLKPNARCSPSNSRCCNRDCSISNSTQVCRHEDDCNYSTYCDGVTDVCPPSVSKPNGTLCSSDTQICQNGQCAVSVCRKFGLNECYLTGSHRSPEEMCLLSCKQTGSTGECKEACEYEAMKDLCGALVHHSAGCIRGFSCHDVRHTGVRCAYSKQQPQYGQTQEGIAHNKASYWCLEGIHADVPRPGQTNKLRDSVRTVACAPRAGTKMYTTNTS